MDPVTLALIMKAAQGGAQGVGSAVQSIGSGVSKIDRLSTEERNRMKELERQQALGLLGLDAAQEQAILNQNLQPVQSLQRELIRQQQQQQSIGDIGQGAAFRQQQAQQGAMQQATSAAQQQAQDQILQLDRLAEAEQKAELARLKQQRQQNIQGAFEIARGAVQGVGAVAGAVGQGASVKGFLDEGGAIEALLDPSAYAKQISKAQTEIVQKTSAQPVSPGIASEYEQAIRASVPATPPAPPATPTAPVENTSTQLVEQIVPRIQPGDDIVPRIQATQEDINPRIEPLSMPQYDATPFIFGPRGVGVIPGPTPEELFLQRINMQGQNLPLSRNAALAGASRLGMETAQQREKDREQLQQSLDIPVDQFVNVVNEAGLSDNARRVFLKGQAGKALPNTGNLFVDPTNPNKSFKPSGITGGIPTEFSYGVPFTQEEINQQKKNREQQITDSLTKRRDRNQITLTDQEIKNEALKQAFEVEKAMSVGFSSGESIGSTDSRYNELLKLYLQAMDTPENAVIYEQIIKEQGL